MTPQRHIIASVFSGIVIWIAGRNLTAGIMLVIGGVMPDIDHILEFIMHKGIRGFRLQKVYDVFSPGHEPKLDKLYLFFHSIELLIILWIPLFFLNNVYLTAFNIGYTLHMIMDVKGNNLGGNFYFFLWRMKEGFDVKKLFKNNKDG